MPIWHRQVRRGAHTHSRQVTYVSANSRTHTHTHTHTQSTPPPCLPFPPLFLSSLQVEVFHPEQFELDQLCQHRQIPVFAIGQNRQRQLANFRELGRFPFPPLVLRDDKQWNGGKLGHINKRDAQRQYVVIGTLAPIIVECLFFLCSDWGSGPEGGDVPLNQR